jgi:hypothetical protein
VFGVVSFLSACGGSSDGKKAVEGNPVVTSSGIIKAADKYTAVELKNAANNLVIARYKGKSTLAAMDIEASQRFYNQVLGSNEVDTPDFYLGDLDSAVDANGNIDTELSCGYEGTKKIKGQLDKNGAGKIVITFKDCNEGYYGESTLTGTIAASYEAKDNKEQISFYFDALNWQREETALSLSGYQLNTVNYDDNSGHYDSVSEQKLVFVASDNSQVMIDAITRSVSTNSDSTFSIKGKAYLGDIGFVNISTLNMTGRPYYGATAGQLTLTGDKKVTFEFLSDRVRYAEDSTGDGIVDVGTYFSNIYEIQDGSVADKKLVALADLSLPPYSNSPRLVSYDSLYTTDIIQVEPGYYEDPDTPREQLTISYRWYINAKLVLNQTSDTLPAGLAVYGDEVKVTMIVSDGANAIESNAEYISLEDSPMQLTVNDIPGDIKAGRSVNFSVEITDPDVKDNASAGLLVSGPAGATIDDAGIVSWQVSDDFIFPYQTFDFTFGVADENGEIVAQESVSIKAYSDKDFPIARSGIEVPNHNKSMWVGDFDGDDVNEILSTDNKNSVFLLEHKGGQYQQKWVYPFKLPTKGAISQVLAFNIDDDASEEILVITEYGVSIINDIAKEATVLFDSSESISFAAVADVNNDGTAEFAYLHTDESNSSNKLLSAIKVSNPENILFSTSINDAKQLIFANVDNDNQLELISNNGLIYDAVTWENEWASGTSFGDRSITAGDYDGDGIAEIAGADRWGDITIYSLLTKSQLTSVDNFNTCTIHSANIDDDIADELLVGDCQWGAISAYDLVSSELEVNWQVNMQDHGSASLITGDSDNDGQLEVHWGTGQSHSGQNIFVVADIISEMIDGGKVISAVVKEAALTTQLDNYSSAGWASIDGIEEQAVFFVPKTQSGYGGSKIVMMNIHGEYQLSDEVSSNWDGSRFAVTTDFNNDGFGDIFLPTTETYSGGFAAMQLLDHAIHWQQENNSDSTIGLIKSQDLNNDTFADAIFIDGTVLSAIDINNQKIIFSHSFSGGINDFAIDEDKSIITVAHGNQYGYANISLFSLKDGLLSEQSFLEQSCDRVLYFNADTDSELELLCVTTQTNNYDYPQNIIVYDIVDMKFVEIGTYQYHEPIIDIVVDTSTTTEQNVFVTASSSNNYDYWNDDNAYRIKKISAKGLVIWSGPELVGRPSEHGLKVRYSESTGHQMMLSTNSMMYLITNH